MADEQDTGTRMTSDGRDETDGAFAAASRRASRPEPREYHRPATPHRTMPPVDDLAEDDLEAQINYVHDTDYANRSLDPLSSREYRRNRSELSKAQKDLKYGQYLSVPKGRRAIFARQERVRRIKTIVAAVLLVAVIGVVAYLLWQLIQGALG